MKTVYVIGDCRKSIDEIRALLSIPVNTEVICVNSVDDIPISDRGKDSGIGKISIRNYNAIDRMPELMPVTSNYTDKKTKGWQRPYKFHR